MTPLEIVQRPHRANLVRWAESRPEALVLSADLTASCEADGFREAYPERFVTLGMAEQNMLSFAGGLAREGFVPFVHTFAVFIARRPYDQLAMSVAYPNLPVRLLGFLPGVTTPGGVTHQAIEDLALLRALPNMTLLECADATEVESVLDVAQTVPGPVYVRMLRGAVPRLFPKAEPMMLGRSRLLVEVARPEVLVISSGICTGVALPVVRALAGRGVAVAQLHVSTIKPFDDPRIDEALAGEHLRGVVTHENHTVIGGLGSAVAEVMAESGCRARLVRLGLRDTFAHGASLEHLLGEYHMDHAALLAAVESLLGRSLELSVEELITPESAPEGADDQALPDVL